MEATTILFDLDDTLVVEEASVDEAFLATCEQARERYGIDPQAFCRSVRQCARRIWQAAPTIAYCRAIGISSWEGLWGRFTGSDPNLKALHAWAPTYRREAWSAALAEHDIRDLPFAERLAARFQKERRSRHIVFPDTEPALKRLRESYRLGLITNGAPDIQHEKVQGASLCEYFESVTVSGEVGVGKPDPRIFETALDNLAVHAEMAVMVGNSLKRDVAGAQRAGLRAIWLDRSGTTSNEDVKPYARITSLSDLLKEGK